MSVIVNDNVSIENSSSVLNWNDDPMPPSSRAPRALQSERRRRSSGLTPEMAMEQLHKAQREHPFWENRFFKACKAGLLSREDFKFFFAQYYLYNKNFTRYLAALMANCDSDYHRARLAENLWEEGGMLAPEKRHAEIFRKFLRDGLQIDVENIDFLDSSRYYTREYLDFCLRSHAAAGSAFLSLGTEGIVARMYGIMVEGMLQAGIEEEHMSFFRLHMECDDEHAETLEKMMLFYSAMPDWYNTCLRSMNYALNLRQRFFEKLYDYIELRRLRALLDNIQQRESLVSESPDPKALHHRFGSADMEELYKSKEDALNVDVTVDRVPFTTEVLDTRVVRIPPQKSSEGHKHPHETVLYVIGGEGQVRINEATVEVKAGDLAFVPRWAVHTTHNTGNEELRVLAITDYGLTDQALGGRSKTTRLREDVALGD